MHRRLIVTLLVAPLCAVALACGGGSPVSTATSTTMIPPSTTSTTEAIAVFPGAYATSLASEDLKSIGADDMTLAGDWLFEFTESGDSAFVYVATLNGARAWEGTLFVDGDQIRVSTAETGRECEAEGSYTLEFDGTQLNFSAVSEGCDERKAIFISHPWIRQP